jgi:hypothetical protein
MSTTRVSLPGTANDVTRASALPSSCRFHSASAKYSRSGGSGW